MTSNDRLEEFILASPWPQRVGLRLLLALGRRPRGLALLAKLAPADQAASGVLGLARYDDDGRALELGYDAEALVARGRELRTRGQTP